MSIRRASASASLVTIVSLAFAAPSLAAASSSSSPQLTERETIAAELSSTGAVKVARLITQLSAVGSGRVNVLDPGPTKGLRNLDGFATPQKTKDGVQWNFTVSGHSERRLLSSFTGQLPVTVDVAYTLNGAPISPKALLGKSGTMGVTFHVKNVTAKPTQITYLDATGHSVTETIDLAAPLIGQLSTTLPASFTHLNSPRANIAGDGRGANVLNWALVLFDPLGAIEQTFGYTAQVTKASVPASSVQIVPVTPKTKPELQYGTHGFEQGAKSGADLTAGATLIDSNVIKLRDGAAQLLAGLRQLADGSSTLSAGLNDSAVPGAKRLATGLAKAQAGATNPSTGLPALAAGANKLKGGLDTASTGAHSLANGSADLATGATLVAGGAGQLKAGLTQIARGLSLLSTTTGLPAALAGAQALRFGISHPVGAGGPSDPGGLLEGMTQILGGLSHPAGSAGPSDPGGVLEGLANVQSGLPQAKSGVDLVKLGLDHPVGALGGTDPGGAKQALQAMQAGAQGLMAGLSPYIAANCAAPLDLVCTLLSGAQLFAGQVNAGIGSTATTGTLLNGVAQATGGLGQVSLGLGSAITGVTSLYAGVAQLAAGVSQLKAAVAAHIVPGLDQLVLGLTSALSGVTQLGTGASDAVTGATSLSDGAQQVAAGAAKAADGSSALSSGVDRLAAGGAELATGAAKASTDLGSGLSQLSVGARQLADGLNSAALGARQLADGLAKAKRGASLLPDGANQLHLQGTSKLVTQGAETAMSYGKLAAVMHALDSRGAKDSMPYGAPAGASGTSAYVLNLASQSRASTESPFRALVAIGVLALAAVANTLIGKWRAS